MAHSMSACTAGYGRTHSRDWFRGSPPFGPLRRMLTGMLTNARGQEGTRGDEPGGRGVRPGTIGDEKGRSGTERAELITQRSSVRVRRPQLYFEYGSRVCRLFLALG